MYEYITGFAKNSRDIQKQDGKALDQAKLAYLRLKFLMGARMYMRMPQVHAIFKLQKERIGTMLEAIERELTKTNLRENDRKTIEPWKPQGLKALWDKYMNERFQKAQTRVNTDMDTYLALLEKHWGVKGQASKPAPKPPKPAPKGSKPAPTNPDDLADQLGGLNINDPAAKDFSEMINKLKGVWEKEKKTAWTRPW